MAAPNLGSISRVDTEGQGDGGSGGWDIPLGWNSAKGAEREIPEPAEQKKPRQPGRVPGSRKAAEHRLPGSHFNPGTFERWSPWKRPLPADYRVLSALTTFIKQLLIYLSGTMLRCMQK